MGNNFDPVGLRPLPFVNVLPSTVSPVGMVSGNGTPEGVVPGNVGQRYRDLETNDLYLKLGGTQAIGWELIGKYQDPALTVVGAGTQQVFSGSATDPNGVITAEAPAKYYSTTNASQWDKLNVGTNNTGWAQVA